MALTQLPAVEPLRWGLRGIGGSALLSTVFLKYLFFIILKSNPPSFHDFLPLEISQL
jgi:hypothetical protein